MNNGSGQKTPEGLKMESDNRVMDADYWRRFEHSTNLLYYYAWWLYHFGIIVFFCSATFFVLNLMQLQMIEGMEVLESGSHAKMTNLKDQLEKIVE